MHELVKKIHMYTGLLTFSILLVFGISGLVATFRPAPGSRVQPELQHQFVPFAVSSELTDREVANQVYEALDPPLTVPPADRDIRRDGQNNLVLQFYTMNGRQRVTVVEQEGRLKIETLRNSIWHYFDSLHATSIRSRVDDTPVRLWTYYNEFSIWALILMALSGLYLWLSSRPRYRLAQGSFVAGLGVFVVLYVLTR